MFFLKGGYNYKLSVLGGVYNCTLQLGTPKVQRPSIRAKQRTMPQRQRYAQSQGKRKMYLKANAVVT
jgi:hypothetical protein